MTTIKAMFHCTRCDMKQEVEVREREQKEDIINFTHYVGRMCGERHSLLSPYCPKRELDIMIPITKNGVGFNGQELTQEDKDDLNRQLKGGGDGKSSKS